MNVTRKRYTSARGIILAGFCCLWLFIGCDSSEKLDVLPKDKLAAVYSDMVFAKELYAGNPPNYNAALDSILTVHSTDTSIIRSSFAWYANDTEALAEIYALAVERANARAAPESLSIKADSLGQ